MHKSEAGCCQKLRREILTQQEAEKRSAIVKANIEYQLAFNFARKEDAYETATRVQFILLQTPQVKLP
jgi:hypothetical protein